MSKHNATVMASQSIVNINMDVIDGDCNAHSHRFSPHKCTMGTSAM